MVIESDSIRLNIHAADWREAVTLAALPLVEGGYITLGYIESIIKSVEEMGPYIVIAPGLALSHARPDETVIRNGLALTTLASPVDFGSENDPVSVILTLAATDSESHLEKLQAVAEILADDGRMEVVKAAKDAGGLAEFINNASSV